jgi:phosphatidylserine/phosphatidylglycerophosphate/cardiolipin synthase-like enzyme
VPDTNTADDWAQMRGDVINGRKVLYPGWDLDQFFFSARVTETAVLTIAIAPDNAFEAIVNQIESAARSVHIETLTFENVAIGDVLLDALNRGVSVTVLMEGDPFGGVSDLEKYVCERLESAGGQCWFMINDSSTNIFDRYSYLHAKFMLIDGRRVLIGSENLSPNSLPNDDKSDGTWGRRGVVLITDAPSVVSHVRTIFNLDLGSGDHQDVFRWHESDPDYGAPANGYVPVTLTGGITYATRFMTATVLSGTMAFEVVQSPENSLRDRDGLLGLVNQAGPGDTILVQQLSERPHWGPSGSDPSADPNPRLQAYMNAARRGARVRLLLDAFFDDRNDPVSNSATCNHVRRIALSEGLKLECALGNPAGLGIHNKMILVHIGGHGTIHVGSLNGTELSGKGNRELALQVQSDQAYDLLAEMFEADWPYRQYFPVILNNYIGPADHLLISEILYDPSGLDDKEFVEIANPTGRTVDLTGHTLGDAVNRDDFEDVRSFPAGTSIAPGSTLVVAASATAFRALFGHDPDLEILNTAAHVPDMIDDPSWGDPAAWLQLGNGGDEVILRDPYGRPVDVVAYGTGQFPGVIACGLVQIANASLERIPYWRDSDDCPADFREWPFPNPGSLP